MKTQLGPLFEGYEGGRFFLWGECGHTHASSVTVGTSATLQSKSVSDGERCATRCLDEERV